MQTPMFASLTLFSLLAAVGKLNSTFYNATNTFMRRRQAIIQATSCHLFSVYTSTHMNRGRG